MKLDLKALDLVLVPIISLCESKLLVVPMNGIGETNEESKSTLLRSVDA